MSVRVGDAEMEIDGKLTNNDERVGRGVKTKTKNNNYLIIISINQSLCATLSFESLLDRFEVR